MWLLMTKRLLHIHIFLISKKPNLSYGAECDLLLVNYIHSGLFLSVLARRITNSLLNLPKFLIFFLQFLVYFSFFSDLK